MIRAGKGRMIGCGAAVFAAALSLFAGPAAASMADACKRPEIEIAPDVAALEADGWTRLPSGPETEAALLQTAAAFYYSLLFQVPETAEEVEKYKAATRRRVAKLYTDAVAFRREALTASVQLVPNGANIIVHCIFTGSPLPETFARTIAAGAEQIFPRLQLCLRAGRTGRRASFHPRLGQRPDPARQQRPAPRHDPLCRGNTGRKMTPARSLR